MPTKLSQCHSQYPLFSPTADGETPVYDPGDIALCLYGHIKGQRYNLYPDDIDATDPSPEPAIPRPDTHFFAFLLKKYFNLRLVGKDIGNVDRAAWERIPKP